jgi:hypothetical protein
MPCFVPETFKSLGSGTNTVDSVPERVDGVGKLSLVELGLYFIEGVKEALGGDGRTLMAVRIYRMKSGSP